MHLHAALITLLTVLLISAAMGLVARARGRHQIVAPAISGHPDFDRTFRAHQNTLEQTVMFLPTLWVASAYGNQLWAAVAGYVWLLARAWYLASYVKDAKKRGAGFTVAALAWVVLWLIALVGLFQLYFTR